MNRTFSPLMVHGKRQSVLLFTRTKSLVACLVRKHSIEHHRHLPRPLGKSDKQGRKSMKAVLRLLLVMTTLVLAGHAFRELLPPSAPVTFTVSVYRLLPI